jgi:hypothetical protein
VQNNRQQSQKGIKALHVTLRNSVQVEHPIGSLYYLGFSLRHIEIFPVPQELQPHMQNPTE